MTSRYSLRGHKDATHIGTGIVGATTGVAGGGLSQSPEPRRL